MTTSPSEGDGPGPSADCVGPHHGGGAGEDRTGRAGGDRHRGVPEAQAPAVPGQPSEIRTQGWLLDQDQLAQWLGVTDRFVRRLVAERRIPFVKLGKQVRFDPTDVVVWVEAQKVGPARVTTIGKDVRPRRVN